MKILQHFILITVLAFLLAACASPQSPTSASVPATTVPIQPTGVMATSTSEAAATQVPATEVAATAVPVTGETSGDGSVYVLIPEKSKANYRITEQLVNNDLPNDAVGETNAITGSITLLADGTIDKANSKFTVDLSTLKSDRSMRDNYVRRNVLQTDQYPEAVFVPTEITGLPSPLPQSGNVTFQVKGDLTIRDVTRPVTWDVSGEIANGEATGKATTNFKFADFNINQPKVPVLLSLEDNIILEVEIALKPAGN